MLIEIKKVLYFSFLITLFLYPDFSRAQPTGPFVVSPEVQSDKRITFRYLAPLAKEVKLDAQFDKNKTPMTKDASGIWSVTVGPVKPDIYPYSFIVDGITVMDPANPAYFPNERFKASLVDVRADTPSSYDLKDVPHGTVTYEYYPSMEGTTGTVLVYTPPGYGKDLSKKYPVFYLISGTTDTEETWFKAGKANLILDNLIAESKAKPMIIVMPYGNLAARIAEQKGGAKPGDPMGRDNADAVARAKAFEEDLMKNIIPYVERSYRVLNDKDNRAIGGFSRGGGQTLRAAFGNMDKFSWVCAYASYLSKEEMDRSFGYIIQKPEQTNKNFKLLWIGVGTDDFLYNGTTEFIDLLKASNVKHKSLITSGGHTWMNTKIYLTETAQLLFR
jgi:enterochelin esterase-like enzyme